MAKRSRLESLPVELLHEICGYLLPSHDLLSNGYYNGTNIPDEFDQSQYNSSGPAAIRPHLPGHALLDLHLASHHLYSIVDSFSASQIDTWVKPMSSFPCAKHNHDFPFPDGHKLASSAHHTAQLIGWTQCHCVFCGTYEKYERDLFANGWACCYFCFISSRLRSGDPYVFKHQILSIYGLTMRHLLDYTSRPGHWPVLRFGWLDPTSGGYPSMVFRRSDVERLTTAVHGDWKLHVGMLRRQRAEREAKQEAKDDLLLLERMRELDEECGYVDDDEGSGVSEGVIFDGDDYYDEEDDMQESNDDDERHDPDDENVSNENDSDENDNNEIDNDEDDENDSDEDNNKRSEVQGDTYDDED